MPGIFLLFFHAAAGGRTTGDIILVVNVGEWLFQAVHALPPPAGGTVGQRHL